MPRDFSVVRVRSKPMRTSRRATANEERGEFVAGHPVAASIGSRTDQVGDARSLAGGEGGLDVVAALSQVRHTRRRYCALRPERRAASAKGNSSARSPWRTAATLAGRAADGVEVEELFAGGGLAAGEEPGEGLVVDLAHEPEIAAPRPRHTPGPSPLSA